jgi:putative tryptophan/tyrosine transport system substrate-binding protein
MKRREFITLVGGAAASVPLAARAQAVDKPRRLGVLFVVSKDNPEGPARIAALQQGLESHGWIDGQTLRIDYRFGGSDAERIHATTQDLLSLKPDVVLAQGVVGAAALQRATKSVPVVFVQVQDPVGGGFVTNLARPGGNITGFTDFEYAISGKWLELLKEAAPAVNRALILINPDNRRRWDGYFGVINATAASLKMQAVPAGVHDAAEIERAIEDFAKDPHGGIMILPDATISVHLKSIIGLAERYQLPSVSSNAKSGSLVAYSSVFDQYGNAASYVDRLLRGAAISDLPVQASDRFALSVNLKTAKAIGLGVSSTLLVRADEVIE